MKVQKWKKQEVEEIKQLLEEYPVVGIVDGTSLPSMQLQKIRFKLKPGFIIRMTKSRLLKIALEQVKTKKPGIEKLGSYLRFKIPLLIFSKEGSFKLSKLLIKNRSSSAAKPGQIAPNDITISAGPTEFTPGPIIGELGQVGLKTGVEGGKIAIKEDKLIVHEGGIITDKVASVLAKLGIQPMKIGINLLATYDNGLIFEKDVLNIDEEKYINDIKLAATKAFNLAFNIEYPMKQNIKLMIAKATIEDKAIEAKLDSNTLEIISKVTEHHVKEVEHKVEHKVEVKHEPVKEVHVEHKEEHHSSESKVNLNKFEEDSQKAQDLLKSLQDKKISKRSY
ncbi:MAG: 50S ribosomal protein L10 [Candidatus Nanoarchaeia archaeon]|nr:50S ribosomal protein L10 [Candidatus Nanoarchaeia archaeon]